MNKAAIKPLVILIATITVFIGALFWVATHSFIYISVSGEPTNAELLYQLTNQQNNQATETRTTKRSFKKLVSSKSQEIMVQDGDKSYFEVIKPKGFLRTNTVQADLKQEKGRKFIGDNPGPCMQLTPQYLVSSGCNGLFADIRVHVPASAAQPTYATKKYNGIYANSEGVIVTPEGTLVLLQTPPSIGTDTDFVTGHFITFMNSDFGVANEVSLTDLVANKSYVIEPEGSGFSVYDTDFESVFYYASTAAKPEQVKLEEPKNKGLVPVSLRIQDTSVTALYSVKTEVDQKRQFSEVILAGKTGVQQHITFKQNLLDARRCGTNKLCATTNKGLTVYDISGKKPKSLFFVSGVVHIQNTSQGIIAVRNKELLMMHIDDRKGYVDYSLGHYSYSGIQPVNNGYILALTNTQGKKLALQIEQTTANTDSIDKKISELQRLPGITSASAYGNYIYISPNAGQPKVNPTTSLFGYDPAVVEPLKKKIDQRIDELGIDRKVYTIIYTIN